MSEGLVFNFNGSDALPPRQPQPLPPARKPDWDSMPLQEGIDSWRYIRRNDLAQLAVPFAIALLREGEPVGAVESWMGDEGRDRLRERDQAVVQRAVDLASMLQRALDAARPRA